MKPEFPKPLEGPAMIRSRASSPFEEAAEKAKERRRNRRSKMARPVLVRPRDPNYHEEAQTTVNISRDGYYFVTAAQHYYLGMPVGVTFPYTPGDPCNAEKSAKVVRIDKLPDGKLGIAVQLILA